MFTLLAGDASLNNLVNEDDIWIYVDSAYILDPNLTFTFATADFDGDGDVDQDDGNSISANYGTNLQNLVLTADITDDEMVDTIDFLVLGVISSI